MRRNRRNSAVQDFTRTEKEKKQIKERKVKRIITGERHRSQFLLRFDRPSIIFKKRKKGEKEGNKVCHE